jgi:transposase
MQILYRRCCGLDVHKKSITACILNADNSPDKMVKKREFATHTDALRKLRFWLYANRVTHVAMESSGVYWKPVFNVLEGKLEILLVNPVHFKGVPGRKTDQVDAEWLAELLQCGLLKASFIPPREIRELRDYTRLRVQYLQQRNRIQNRIEKVLEDANIKLGTVASDTLGLSGQRILRAIVQGDKDPGWMADYARGALRKKRAELELALRGIVTDHHRWLLDNYLDDIEHIDQKIAEIERQIRRRLEPHQELIARLDEIPGVDEITAWTLLAEIGLNMDQFQTPERLASWAGLCPGNNQSGGKRYSGRTRKGNRWLRRALTQVGWAVSHCKDNYLRSLYWRLAARRGKKRAAIAVAHRVLSIAFYMIRDGATYRELGGSYFDQIHPQKTVLKLLKRIQKLGYEVTVSPLQAKSASV